ncbi:hypothetical protein L6J37_02940 [Photobacterium sp. WH77]|uniref:Uncharacterized protein n=1 Tax=Photobacterium arenosum TaxID=2774143 RepID=A0ABR9BL00_9GAMM|nr:MULTISPECIES: hypothetical protein [Photobacterium]MBD8512345.1 hypothetical protein [Photobacterium arenosum]MCG2835816.1 hypothetical protein [Photobacterium sp. WH77]MCG2843507.1 hypothetical protein [Photobacterium sp. WH80]MDO6579856.1 hypothetical protein [Photobacterium sp. 2_MG-2023]
MKHRRVSNRRVKQILEDAGIRAPFSDQMHDDRDMQREGKSETFDDSHEQLRTESDRK